jgi:hypothetical protein
MKCVQCHYDSRARERGARLACPQCKHEFAFDPKTDRISDAAFKSAIDVVSEQGRLAWNSGHLYYEVAGWLHRRSWSARLMRRRYVELGPNTFDLRLARWHDVHGVPPGEIVRRSFAEEPDDIAPDAADYSFERVVICEDEDFADFLLANAFHADNRTLVFAANGYPEHVYAKVEDALAERPPQAIYVLHDASPEGCALGANVAEDRRWRVEPGATQVVDIGLRPAAARQFRGVYLHGQPRETGTTATNEERAWLARYRLDLEAVRPRTMLLALVGIVQAPLGELGERVGQGPSGLWVLGDLWDGANLLGSDDYTG